MKIMENSYGISLRNLTLFAEKIYPQINPMEAALKAISVLLFKLEGQVILRNPDYKMEDKLLLHKVDVKRQVVEISGKEYKIKKEEFPTVSFAAESVEEVYQLTEEEENVMEGLQMAFVNSIRLRQHIDFLYKKGSMNPKYRFEMPEEKGIGEVRFLALQGLDTEKYEYNFQIDERVWIDPYVRELAGTKKFGVRMDVQKHQARGKFVRDAYDWEDDKRPHLAWNDVIAYSLHIRGFTKHSSSHAVHKGTYLGIVEKIPYLLQLGINQIQCMPVYEFDEYVQNKINFWGYGKGFYFAPKSSYASGSSAVKELKDMVKACHRAGIEVVLEMPFEAGISAQKAMECLKFYLLEYHVDGFVVNPYNVPWDELNADPLLKEVKIMKKEEGFQTIMRRFLKGDENMIRDVMWALKHNSSADGVCNSITAQTGFTLWDLVSYDGKHNEENGERNQDGPDYNYSWNCGAEGPSRKKNIIRLRKNQVKNAYMLLLTAQGTPCLLAGDVIMHIARIMRLAG